MKNENREFEESPHTWTFTVSEVDMDVRFLGGTQSWISQSERRFQMQQDDPKI